MITSVSNQQVKNIILLNQKSKERRERKLFCAEGRKMFLEAPKEMVFRVYMTEEAASAEEVQEKLRRDGLVPELVSEQVFHRMCDTMTPQGILTVLRSMDYSLEEVLEGTGKRAGLPKPGESKITKNPPLLLILEDLQDPGNLGTILRTAEGAGVTGILLTEKCVDITNPKVIRSTMGSVYRMPFRYVESVSSLKDVLKERGIRTFAAHLAGKNTYDRESYQGGTAFLIGNEGNGLSEEASRFADCRIRIPMEGKVESLNAAMAAGILMYEAYRQRRTECPKKGGIL